MNSSIIQLLVLAGVAIFLFIKLRSVLGTRDGFEKPPLPLDDARPRAKRDFEVIEGGPDRDITDLVPEGSPAAVALSAMKKAEPGFSVGTFLQGARGAYEMILMAFDKGELASIKPFLAPDVFETFSEAVAQREKDGLRIESTLSACAKWFCKKQRLIRQAAKPIFRCASLVRQRHSCAMLRVRWLKAARLPLKNSAISGHFRAAWGRMIRTGFLAPPEIDAWGLVRLRNDPPSPSSS